MDDKEERRPSIPKWPFWLGDVLLVSIALLIGKFSNWAFSDIEIIACILSVALGSGLFVFPYLFEYALQVKYDQGKSESILRTIGQHLNRLNSLTVATDEAVDACREGQRIALKKVADLEKRLVEIKESKGSEEDVIPGKTATLLKQEISAIAEKQNLLEAKLGEIQSVAPAKHRPQKEKTGKNRLLSRAIKEKEVTELHQVGRIIEAKKSPDAENTNSEETESAASTADSPQNNSGNTAETHLKTEVIDAPSSRKTVDPEPDTVTVTAKKTEPDAEESKEDLFGQTMPIKTNKPRTRTGKKDTVLTVHSLIGIGNKPYLRGSGAGLNWEKGIAMEFQGIGKWEWKAPEPLSEAIEIQVYCNDTDPDKTGKHTISPGDKLEIRASFN